jgi:hypothetical protein
VSFSSVERPMPRPLKFEDTWRKAQFGARGTIV